MEYTFEHIDTLSLDPNVDGSDKKVEFKCERFIYYAFCIDGILQYVKGEHPSSYLNWDTPPTEGEILSHDARREDFNQNHEIIQTWIDSL